MARNALLSPDVITRELDDHDGPALLVLPSTHAMVEAALNRTNQAGTLLITDPSIISSALDPARYLSACRQAEARGEWVPNAYVFTDQFVDAPFAALLAQHEGRQEFMTATEVLARANYAIDVYIWTDTGSVPVSAMRIKDPVPVLRVLATYYQSCARLGEDWLMRERQCQRQPEVRLSSSARRLRLYESLVMQAFVHDEINQQARALLRDLGERRSAVMGEVGIRQ